MFSLLVTFALLAAVNAGPLEQRSTYDNLFNIFPHGRIIGGENAVIETYPHQVSLQYKDQHICGASIIAKHYILTAGHCSAFDTEDYTVRAGTTFKGKGGSEHKVEKVLRHERYSSNYYGIPTNDIAIMRVKEAFEFDDTRRAIQLFKNGESCDAGVKAVVTGWGMTEAGVAASQLQTVIVPIVSKQQCTDAYRGYGGLPDGQICAAYYGEGGKDACQGDSGGPLTIDGRLVGIVSWGNGCALAYYPGAYTEVAHYREWIEKNAEL